MGELEGSSPEDNDADELVTSQEEYSGDNNDYESNMSNKEEEAAMDVSQTTPPKSNSQKIRDIDTEMRQKLRELQQLMIGGGLSEAATEVSEMIQIHEAMQGKNHNSNATNQPGSRYKMLVSDSGETIYKVAIGGSKGGRQGRAPPPGGPNSFIFMQFSAKIINKHTHFGSWRPPLGKILDPPLVAVDKRNSSSSEEEPMDTSDETVETIPRMLLGKTSCYFREKKVHVQGLPGDSGIETPGQRVHCWAKQRV